VTPKHRTSAVLAVSLFVAAGLAASGGCTADKPKTTPQQTYQGALCSDAGAGDLFQRKIAPLLADDRPSTCNQCHLSGIDLKSVVSDSPCSTMACMVDQGMVNLQQPDESLILTWIKRAHPESALITQQVIDQEYDGFLQWIQYNAACGAEVCKGVTCNQTDASVCPTAEAHEAPLPDGAPPTPYGCGDRDIEQMFLDDVYSSRGRCAPCHFDNWTNNNLGSPSWIHVGGTCNQGSLATLREVERLGLINIDDPTRSLLLLKPLSVEGGGVMHGGGAKFELHPADASYLSFRRFVQHYAACRKGTLDDGGPNTDAAYGGGMLSYPAHPAADAGQHFVF
jgi:hypothetical protein